MQPLNRMSFVGGKLGSSTESMNSGVAMAEAMSLVILTAVYMPVRVIVEEFISLHARSAK